MPTLDDPRVTSPGDAAVRSDRPLVVYWMIGARRVRSSPALDRALAWCRELDKPLLVVEPLRVGYRWASERIHAFVIEGMRDNAAAFARAGIAYHPYLEPEPGAGKGLVRALADSAAVIVTDDALGFFQPHAIAKAAREIDVRLEVVDGNGILPVRASPQAFPSALALRRVVQRTAARELARAPSAQPLAGAALKIARGARVPREIERRWPAADLDALAADAALDALLRTLPLDHDVRRVTGGFSATPRAASTATLLRGGAAAAHARLAHFIAHGLKGYATDRSHPDADAHSGLSPWLHFGHLGAHEVVDAVARARSWSPAKLAATASGRKEGFWNVDADGDAFLDELVTWRELALNGAAFLDAFASFDATPAWAQASLRSHAHDKRAFTYSAAELERAQTHDDVWNAAQRELVETGVMHNALRMLWGKNVLAWSSSPRAAFDVLVDLNNKYALDGRDASSYAGIGWIFGRYDRPWPERAVFGTVRCMTTASTGRKLEMKAYLRRFSPTIDRSPSLFPQP